ncbi:MAG: arginine--tRNA ligase, partial [Thermoanaerobaculum sp.]|nr:arginine--tRNA ligase [Thermoanaerobaculum sp.]
MLRTIQQALEALIGQELATRGWENLARLEVPPHRQWGDLAWAGALPLAKALRQPPRLIGEQLAQALGARLAQAQEGSALAFLHPQVRVDGPGFLNFRLKRGAVLAEALRADPWQRAPRGEKIIVEHTNINPNKAAHIGHLRNAVLGDVLVRCLRFLGYPVEVQNYIDDTGVQVADVVVGFLFLPEEELVQATAATWPGLASRQQILAELVQRWEQGGLLVPANPEADFDDLCWDLYPRVTRWYEEDPQALARRGQVLHALEAGPPAGITLRQVLPELATGHPSDGALACLGTVVAEANLRCHLHTMGELGIAYDVLPHESDVLRRGLWQRAFELLRRRGCIHQEKDGKNAGCWVMPLAEAPEFAGLAEADKILVRSNGTVTYTGKDIAYQLWKLGLLWDENGSRCDFGYKPFARWEQAGPAAPVRYGQGPRVVYRTTAEPHPHTKVSFGGGRRVFNVIDVRQTYPQKVVREAVRALGFAEAAENSVHFSYEMVALTPKAVHQLEASLGISFGLLPEEEEKPFVEMSGRRGIGVKANALLRTLREEAEKAIRGRLASGQKPQDLQERAHAIAVGALRYQMARQGRNRVLAFDFADALAFEGDTGPYLQYAAVRTRKIFDKLHQAGLAGSADADGQAVGGMEVPDDNRLFILREKNQPPRLT